MTYQNTRSPKPWQLLLVGIAVVGAMATALPVLGQSEMALSDQELELVEVDWFEEMLEGGMTMVALGALSVALVAFTIERLVRMRASNIVPPRLLSELLPLFHQKQYEQILAQCKKRPSALADIAAFLVVHRKADPQILLTAAGDLGGRAVMNEERRCQPFAVIAGIAPLLGLLGTMIGMIESFKLVEVFGDEGGASLLAGSISKALITTAVGLILAIPGLLAYHGFKHRAQAIGVTLEEATEKLFNAWFLSPRSTIAAAQAGPDAAERAAATPRQGRPRPAPQPKPAVASPARGIESIAEPNG